MYYQDRLSFVQHLPSPDGVWELVEKIGEGNYGVVFKGRNRKTGKLGAIKIMDAILDKEEDIQAELNVFENFSSHENIVDCYGVYLKKQDNAMEQIWIAMEHCTGGSVTDLVKKLKEKGESLPEEVIAFILREVLTALTYLHNNNVIHRDIKGQNVLMTHDGRIRLIDFGISAVVSHAFGRRRTAIGTPYWMSPEVIACEHQLDCDYDARADIWSLGITAIEIVDGTPPLFGENPIRALFKIPKNPPPKLQNPNRWSIHLNKFIARCLVKDFERRPTSHQLAQTDLIILVPKDSRMLRRKLMAIIDTYVTHTNETEELLSEHSSPPSTVSTGLDTAQRNMLGVRTIELVDDLATLEYIDEGVMVGQLMKRYRKGFIYTYVGDVLVSVNPFQHLPDMYDAKVSKQYRGITKTSKGRLRPHIFAIASSAYQELIRENKNQCCVISGESGAGKTEASNILVRQFMQIGRAKASALGDKIISLNPLLEAFGNARTVINNNSSRFGKYLEINISEEGFVVGAHLSEYLLEKSRVISQGGRERNFHIFYYLLAGLRERKLSKQFKIKHGKQFRYLRQIGTVKATAKQNQGFAEKFAEVETAFDLFGFSKTEFEQVCRILAGILNIGDIHIEENIRPTVHLEEVSVVANPTVLDDISELLGIDSAILEKVIISSSVITHGETIVRPNTVEQAMDCRDAMSKSLYGRLFSWIVNKINPTLNPSKDKYKRLLNIGILDIFGFENFQVNSFEQLCINITNEQLQFYFNQHVFAWELEEYEREGIDGAHISYTDNRPLLELLLNRPMGLLALLDEECKFPRATDMTLAAKFHSNMQHSHLYIRPKDNGPNFTISHYAGTVIYTTQGFLEKNRDTLKPEVVSLMRESGNIIVHQLFAKSLTRTGNLSEGSITKIPASATPLFNRRKPTQIIRSHTKGTSVGNQTPLSKSVSITTKRSQTVSTYFFYSLRELMAKMLLGTPHFVRCIRPNDLKTPQEFHPERVIEQLRYTGVLETTRIRREGYSHRILFEDFLQRYRVISYQLSRYVSPTPVNCVQVLMQAGLEKWAIGKTKVFLKYYHVERLWRLLSNYHRFATKIQCATRGWLARREVNRLRREKAAICIQSVVRGFITKKHFQRNYRRRLKAVILLQKNVRKFLSQRRYQKHLRQQKAAITIQTNLRCWMYRRKYLAFRYATTNAARVIQRSVRKWLNAKRRERIVNQSATIIQKAYRKYYQRKLAEERRKLEEQAAISVSEPKGGSLRSRLEHHVVQEIKRRCSQQVSTDPNVNEEVKHPTEPLEQIKMFENEKEPKQSSHETFEGSILACTSTLLDMTKTHTNNDIPKEKCAEIKLKGSKNDTSQEQKEIENKFTGVKVAANGQAQRVRNFFEELVKDKPKARSHYPVERKKKKALHSDVFQKLLEHFDHA